MRAEVRISGTIAVGNIVASVLFLLLQIKICEYSCYWVEDHSAYFPI